MVKKGAIMKWNETTASKCRYGDVAEKVWGDWEILWEDSEADYQGHASFLAKRGKKYCFYEWWYGSCSGCDGWEASEQTDEQIEAEMRDTAMWFTDKKELAMWLNNACMVGVHDGRANYDMERGGGLAAGIDILSGGAVDRFQAMRKAVGLENFNFDDCKDKT
jgi:hypothetical protein